MMRLIREKLRNLGNKGLSIVELICAIAIVSILGMTVSGVMVVSANTYKRGSAETTVQQEAQLVCNQISDLIIDSTAAVEFAAASKKLTITQADSTVYVVYLDGTDLKFKEHEGSNPDATAYSEAQLMAENVTAFAVDVTNFTKTGNIVLNLTTQSGSHTYPATFTITSRNKALAIGDIMVDKIKLTQTTRRWLVEPGQTDVDLSSYVSVNGVSGITWAVTGEGKKDGTTIGASTGVLNVAIDEQCAKLKVSATTSGINASTVYIDVYVRRVKGITARGEFLGNIADQYGAGAVYESIVDYSGTSLNQVTDAPYDKDDGDIKTRFINPKQSTFAIIEGAEYATVNPNTGIVTLTQSLPGGSKIVVQATASHPAGVNRSGAVYGSFVKTYEIENENTNMPPYNPIIVVDDGWKRMTDTEQANIDTSQLALIAQWYHDTYGIDVDYNNFSYEVKFCKKDGNNNWEGPITGSGNLGSDAGNSINIRPIISQYMDPTYDYDVKITFKLDDCDYSLTFGQTMKKFSAKFYSDYFEGESLSGWDRDSMPILRTSEDLNNRMILKVDRASVTGVEKKDMGNAFHAILEKEDPTAEGGWREISGGFQESASWGLFLSNKIDVNNDPNAVGVYRIKVYVVFPNDGGDGLNNRFSNFNHNGTKGFKLFDENTGDGIFYFEFSKTKTPTTKWVAPTLEVCDNPKLSNSFSSNDTWNHVKQGKLVITNEGKYKANKTIVYAPYGGDPLSMNIYNSNIDYYIDSVNNVIRFTVNQVLDPGASIEASYAISYDGDVTF